MSMLFFLDMLYCTTTTRVFPLFFPLPNVQEDREEGAPPPLLLLQELDDLLVPVLGSQVQRGLAVAVARIQVDAAL